jgi:hypothetical protein
MTVPVWRSRGFLYDRRWAAQLLVQPSAEVGGQR